MNVPVTKEQAAIILRNELATNGDRFSDARVEQVLRALQAHGGTSCIRYGGCKLYWKKWPEGGETFAVYDYTEGEAGEVVDTLNAPRVDAVITAIESDLYWRGLEPTDARVLARCAVERMQQGLRLGCVFKDGRYICWRNDRWQWN